MTKHKKLRRLAPVLFAVIFIMAACSACSFDSGSPTPTPVPPQTTAPTKTPVVTSTATPAETTVSSAYTDKANAAISEVLDIVKRDLAASENSGLNGNGIVQYGFETCRADYAAYLNNNVVSVVFEYEQPNDCIYYLVYNFDATTGDEVTNAQLLAIRGISQADFEARLVELCKDQLVSQYGDIVPDILHSDFRIPINYFC